MHRELADIYIDYENVTDISETAWSEFFKIFEKKYDLEINVINLYVSQYTTLQLTKFKQIDDKQHIKLNIIYIKRPTTHKNVMDCKILCDIFYKLYQRSKTKIVVISHDTIFQDFRNNILDLISKEILVFNTSDLISDDIGSILWDNKLTTIAPKNKQTINAPILNTKIAPIKILEKEQEQKPVASSSKITTTLDNTIHVTQIKCTKKTLPSKTEKAYILKDGYTGLTLNQLVSTLVTYARVSSLDSLRHLYINSLPEDIIKQIDLACEERLKKNIKVSVPKNDKTGLKNGALVLEVVGNCIFPFHKDK